VKRLVAIVAIGLTLAAAPARESLAQAMHTDDVARRGLTERDFPRTRQLAPGIYSYEALRAGDPGGWMTTVRLVVGPTDGVLVSHLQRTVESVGSAIAALVP
jgi:hypothetical protein